MTPRFDESLTRLVDVVATKLGAEALASGVVLRDASGRLVFFSATVLAEEQAKGLADALIDALGVYARSDRPVVSRDEPGAERVLKDPGVRERELPKGRIRYLDRRLVGADWLRKPLPLTSVPARFVFASLKGGVGRSTALSVVAAEQSRQGKNVLVVDLDLEAPGIGSMLLGGDRRPRFGSLDYLVERNFGQVGDLDAFVGTSALTAGAGLVDVVPVVGLDSLTAPENYLAKLSRAMLEGVGEDGTPTSLAEKLAGLLSELESRRTYDLVLVDARAGLAELAAGPLLGLGANVLLFGTAQTQTLEGLRFLFAHLASLIAPGTPSPWSVLKMVHAKAQQLASQEQFRDELSELFAEYLYEEQTSLTEFNFGPNDPDAPHSPIVVPLDLAFADWDPTAEPSKLIATYYARTYGALLSYVDDVQRGPQS